jgi:DNA repair protein RadC
MLKPITTCNRIDHILRGLIDDQLHREEEDSLIRCALEILQRRHRPGKTISSPAEMQNHLRLAHAEHEDEIFGAVWLNQRHCILQDEVLFNGTLDSASVYPRTVIRLGLKWNAAAVVFFHNHPSGNPEPSEADRVITRKLRDALDLVGIRVLDHIVIGSQGTYCFSEHGLL